MGKGIVADISVSDLQKILKDEEFTYHDVKTWKESNDPDFERKKHRINRLTRKEHNPPVVMSFDEVGPLQFKSVGGGHWQISGHPDRVPATYSRKGTRQLLLAFNYHHGTFFGRLSVEGSFRRTYSHSSWSCAATTLRSSACTS